MLIVGLGEIGERIVGRLASLLGETDAPRVSCVTLYIQSAPSSTDMTASLVQRIELPYAPLLGWDLQDPLAAAEGASPFDGGGYNAYDMLGSEHGIGADYLQAMFRRAERAGMLRVLERALDKQLVGLRAEDAVQVVLVGSSCDAVTKGICASLVRYLCAYAKERYRIEELDIEAQLISANIMFDECASEDERNALKKSEERTLASLSPLLSSSALTLVDVVLADGSRLAHVAAYCEELAERLYARVLVSSLGLNSTTHTDMRPALLVEYPVDELRRYLLHAQAQKLTSWWSGIDELWAVGGWDALGYGPSKKGEFYCRELARRGREGADGYAAVTSKMCDCARIAAKKSKLTFDQALELLARMWVDEAKLQAKRLGVRGALTHLDMPVAEDEAERATRRKDDADVALEQAAAEKIAFLSERAQRASGLLDAVERRLALANKSTVSARELARVLEKSDSLAPFLQQLHPVGQRAVAYAASKEFADAAALYEDICRRLARELHDLHGGDDEGSGGKGSDPSLMHMIGELKARQGKAARKGDEARFSEARQQLRMVERKTRSLLHAWLVWENLKAGRELFERMSQEYEKIGSCVRRFGAYCEREMEASAERMKSRPGELPLLVGTGRRRVNELAKRCADGIDRSPIVVSPLWETLWSRLLGRMGESFGTKSVSANELLGDALLGEDGTANQTLNRLMGNVLSLSVFEAWEQDEGPEPARVALEQRLDALDAGGSMRNGDGSPCVMVSKKSIVPSWLSFREVVRAEEGLSKTHALLCSVPRHGTYMRGF